nr:RNA-directed DNA polymerase, eukaryota [Tanacetum cinerariifolium]
MTTPTVTSSTDCQMHNKIMAAGSRDRPPMLATGRYPQWRSRFLRYIDTRPNGEALRKCILNGPYKPTTFLVQAVAATDDSSAIPKHTTEMWEAIERLQQGESLDIQDVKTNLFREFGRYLQWRSWFLQYIDTIPNGDALRKCILNGPYKPNTILVQAVAATNDSPAIPEHTTVETPMNMSPANKAHFESEKEAIHLILTGIGDEIYSTVDACQIA